MCDRERPGLSENLANLSNSTFQSANGRPFLEVQVSASGNLPE